MSFSIVLPLQLLWSSHLLLIIHQNFSCLPSYTLFFSQVFSIFLLGSPQCSNYVQECLVEATLRHNLQTATKSVVRCHRLTPSRTYSYGSTSPTDCLSMRVPRAAPQSFRSSAYSRSHCWRDPSLSFSRRAAAQVLEQGLQRRERFLSFSLRTPVATAWGKYVIDNRELLKLWQELCHALELNKEIQDDVRKMVNSKENTDKVRRLAEGLSLRLVRWL